MKKLYAFALVTVMALSAVACGSGKGGEVKTDSTQAETNGNTDANENASSQDESNVAMATEAEYYVFNVSTEFQIESDAWLGVIPTGTIYTEEVDADEVDMIYTYAENYDMDGITSYRFAFEKDYFNSVEDGIYDIVLCSSDNGEVGKVLLQIGMEKSGDNITLDFKNEK